MQCAFQRENYLKIDGEWDEWKKNNGKIEIYLDGIFTEREREKIIVHTKTENRFSLVVENGVCMLAGWLSKPDWI